MQTLSNLQARNYVEFTVDAQFILVESFDSIEALEQSTGCPIITSWFSNAVFPHEDFAPSFEFIEEHHDFYEMVFVLTDDNTTVFIIPKEKVDPLLLSLCEEFS
ncbi:MAG: hypothetical protein NTZ45_01430 [Methylococcales bacterium]|nr:hypothetical protein [Methylococcales bacterium]